MIIFDSDDFGANHIISDMCQSHDCRDQLDKFHYANPNFKATLFAIPAEMTYELAEWCKANNSWIELAVHGIFHSSNYECDKMTYDEFDRHMYSLRDMLDAYFVKGFKAPGWQISDEVYQWLSDNDYWVGDKSYNNDRRPVGIPAYVNRDGNDFFVTQGMGNVEFEGIGSHHHCWDCVGNGVYAQEQEILSQLENEAEFKFVSEVLNDNL